MAVTGTAGTGVVTSAASRETSGGGGVVNAATISGDLLTIDDSSLSTAFTLTFQPGVTSTASDGTVVPSNIEVLNLTTGSADDTVTFVDPVYDPVSGPTIWDGGGGKNVAIIDLSMKKDDLRSYVDIDSQYIVQELISGTWQTILILRNVASVSITGGSGNNVLKAIPHWSDGSGSTLIGGSGNNTLIGADGNDVFIPGTGTNTIDGNGGANTLLVNDPNNSGAYVNLLTGVATGTGIGPTTLTNIEDVIYNGAGNDTIIGNASTNDLQGGTGRNYIVEGSGSQGHVYDWGHGSTDDGGSGQNVLYLDRDSMTQDVTLTFNPGSNVPVTLPDGTSFVNFEWVHLITGSGNDNLTLNNPVFTDIARRNTWDAGGGVNTLTLNLSNYTTDITTTMPDSATEDFWTQGVNFAIMAHFEVYNITGGSGNDTLIAAPGTDNLDGGPGVNTAVFSGNYSTYTVSQNGHGVYTVSGSGVTAQLTNIEHAQFSDQTVTLDLAAPTLISTAPADNATGVAPSTSLVLTFSEAVKAGSGNIVIHRSSDGSVVATISATDTSKVNFSGATVTINAAGDLTWGSGYYVTIDGNAIEDTAGDDFAGISSAATFAFSTATHVASDFNGDGDSDLLWQSTDGQAGIWFMSGTSIVSSSLVGANPGPDWHVISSADFDGDGHADILWQNTGGQADIWLMNGSTILSSALVGANPGPDWQAKGAADFDGDGHADILWQSTGGQAGIWFMNGTSIVSSSLVGPNPGPDWHIVGTGDFNGDGKADILWQCKDGQAAVWLMNGTTLVSGTVVGPDPGPDWQIKGVGDFNGDGKADILWQSTSGQAGIWFMNGTALVSSALIGANPGTGWQVVGAEDLNGDGNSDILWQSTSGQAGVWFMSGTTITSSSLIGANPGTAWHMIAGSGG